METEARNSEFYQFCDSYETFLFTEQNPDLEAGERKWLESPAEGRFAAGNKEDALRALTAGWDAEQWFTALRTLLERGSSVPLFAAHACQKADASRLFTIIQEFLPEKLILSDWNRACDAETDAAMGRFSDAALLLEQCFPDAFADWCTAFFRRVPMQNEFLTELFSDGIVQYAQEDVLLRLLSESEPDRKTALLCAICRAGVRSDPLYRIFKTSFLQASDNDEKGLLADLLGDYGDARAIPVLRRYLGELLLAPQPEQAACARVAGAVQRLGGSAEDLFPAGF